MDPIANVFFGTALVGSGAVGASYALRSTLIHGTDAGRTVMLIAGIALVLWGISFDDLPGIAGTPATQIVKGIAFYFGWTRAWRWANSW